MGAPCIKVENSCNKKREPQYKAQEDGTFLGQNQLNRLQMVHLNFHLKPLCLIQFGVNPFFSIFSPCCCFLSSSLWGKKKREPQYEAQEDGQFLGQNQLNRLQMVQFECPKYRNPCVSFTYG